MDIRIYRVVGLALIASAYLFAGFACSKEEEINASDSKIDLCDYGSDSFDELEVILKDRVLGKKNFDPLLLFVHAPLRQPPRIKVTKALQRITTIPTGFLSEASFKCLLPAGNKNIWKLVSLQSEAGIEIMIQLNLIYDDQNFYQRREHINSKRYVRVEDVVKAVKSLAEKNNYNRPQLKKMMEAGNFLYHRSCEKDDTISDVFIFPLPPPESLTGLWGVEYFNPNGRQGVTVNFYKSDGKFLSVKPGHGRGSGYCKVLTSLSMRQAAKSLVEKYPNSWYSQFIIKNDEQQK